MLRKLHICKQESSGKNLAVLALKLLTIPFIEELIKTLLE